MKIQLYPSLQFGWDIPQFQTVADEYLKRNETEEETADNSEEEIQLYKQAGNAVTATVAFAVAMSLPESREN